VPQEAFAFMDEEVQEVIESEGLAVEGLAG
jgi:hypothetical protein